jgi:hypothetical protein
MATYEIKVYQSEELNDWCLSNVSSEFQAAENVVSYLNGINQDMADDLKADVSYERGINPMEEEKNKGFPARPCGSSPKWYTDVWDWWSDYCPCNISNPAKDSNLLLTNTGYSTGGRASTSTPPYAFAQTQYLTKRVS